MQIIIKTAHHTWRWTLRFCIYALLAVALLLAALRLSLPLVGDYRAELEQRISAHVNLPVKIKQLNIAWWGWGPALRIDGFSLLDPNDKNVRFGFHNALISLDMARSLWTGRLMLHHVMLQGGQLIMQWSPEYGLQLLPNQQATNTSVSMPELIAWLFQTNILDFRFDQLIIQHPKQSATNKAPILSGGELRLSVSGDDTSRRLDATLALPQALGNQLQAAVKLNTQPTQPEQWQAEFYLRGQRLALSALPFIAQTVDTAEVDIELWGSWQNDALQELIGQIHLAQLAFAESAQTASAAIDLQWQPKPWGWHLHHRINANIAAQNFAAQDFNTVVDLNYRETAQGTAWLEGETQHLPLSLLATMASPFLAPAQQQLLHDLAPGGTITELNFRLPHTSQQWQFEQLQLNASVDDLQLQARQKIPGINGLRGEIALAQDHGWLSLPAQTVAIDWNLLRAPVVFNRLAGVIEWPRDEHTWSLSTNDFAIANADLNLQTRGQVILPPNSAHSSGPILDLRVDYSDINIAKIRHYLPAAVLKPKLLGWLDHAFISGYIPFGGLVFLGALQDFPFDDGNGVFETRFITEDMVFDYKPGWPRIEQLNAEVIFRNKSFTTNARSGKIFDVDLRDVQASIEHLNKSPLQIHGLVHGPGASMLRFVHESPLEQKVGRHLRGIELSQENELDLTLTIPLKKSTGQKPQVKGILSFTDNRVTIAEHNVDMNNVRGQLTFTEKDLYAENLDVEFRGDPARLSIAMPDQGKHKGTLQFDLRGRLGLNALLGKEAPLFEPFFEGRSHWHVKLTIPRRSPDRGPRFSIDFQSDLAGTAVDLPKPLAKTAKLERPLKGRVEIGAGMQLTLAYAPNAQAIIQLTRDNGKLRFNRGELRINQGTPELPKEPGLKTFAHLEKFDLTALGAGKPLPDWFTTLQVQIDELAVGDQRLHHTDVDLVNNSNGLHMNLEGEDVTGQIIVPAVLDSRRPIQVQLQHMVLSSDDTDNMGKEDNPAAIDPRRLPPLQLVVDDLQLDGRSLGNLALLVTPTQQGLNIEQLELQSEQHLLSATGSWQVFSSGRQRSHLRADFRSPALGATLAALGYQSVDIKGAEILADLDVTWSGPVMDFSPTTMQGLLNLQIGKGQFMKLDPGLGRVVGLFNIATLTRRLQLDFSDLFESGLAFDSIGGEISFNAGRAYTDNLLLQGPSAHILFDGSLDLVNRQFDQTVTIMPQLSSSLALAGALTGGPAIGAAVLLAGQLFKAGLDKVIAYQYSLSGPWDDPEVVIVKQPQSPGNSGFGQR